MIKLDVAGKRNLQPPRAAYETGWQMCVGLVSRSRPGHAWNVAVRPDVGQPSSCSASNVAALQAIEWRDLSMNFGRCLRT